jgi:hypothetical protein
MIRTILLRHYGHVQRTPRKRETWDFIRPIIFGVGLMFALIPSFYPITDHEFVILPLMALVIFITHLALTLRTLSAAASMRVRVWGEDASTWDMLAMTGISARQFIWRTHCAIVQRAWLDHVVFSLLRLGLAVGMAQLLHMINPIPLYNHNLSPLVYESLFDYYTPLSPDNLQIILGSTLLAVFALVEARLLTALYLFVSLWISKGGQARRLGATLVIRILLILSTIAAWVLLEALKTYSYLVPYCVINSYCVSLDLPPINFGKWVSDVREISYNVDGIRKGFTALGDNATLLVADLIRPSFGILFIFSAIPRILMGMGLYWAIIRLALWGAVRLAMRRGMLP